MSNKTIVDAIGILRRFLSARGFEETDAVDNRYDGHAMLRDLHVLTHAMPEEDISRVIAKVMVRLECGYQFEGEALIDNSLNPWKRRETDFVVADLPILAAAVQIERARLLQGVT